MKKLYLVEPNQDQKDNRESYEVYLGFVICADNEDEARDLSFADFRYDGEFFTDKELDTCVWVSRESKHLLKVKYLGIADDSVKKGCVLDSFLAA